jgi:hypothetical protein
MDVMELFDLRYYEAVEIQALNLNTVLWMIQFWITSTFALIVAFHFAGDQFSRPIAALVHSLYLMVTIVSLVTYIQAAGAIIFWNDIIDAKAVSYGVITQAQFDVATYWRLVSVWGGGVLMVLGTIATTFYGLHVRKSEKSEE